jgi:glycerol-3-phosphate dehydrogenase (NAD(P)+)
VIATVMGAGSWGTTFAKVLADAGGTDVRLWARRPEIAEAVERSHENVEYLPGVKLPDTVRATADATAALDGADLAVFALPSQTLRRNLEAVRAVVPSAAMLLSLAKGVELGTTLRMSEVIRDVLGAPEHQVAVLTGPNLAREIADGQPTASVIACVDHDRAAAVQRACFTPYFRPYTNADVVGCELGGAVKNVIALACGVAEGMGFGDNTKAALMTRGLAETARLGAALGADPLTFAGLAGLGDLVATCSSPLSRNHMVGTRLGRGESVEQAQAETGQTAEGVKSCRSILDLAERHGVQMPITEVIVKVCYEGMKPGDMVRELMAREMKPERTR